MMRRMPRTLPLLLLVVLSAALLVGCDDDEPTDTAAPPESGSSASGASTDAAADASDVADARDPADVSGGAAATPGDATYRVEGRAVPLRDGAAEEPAAPGSAALVVTRLMATGTPGDLDGDGWEDAAVVLAQEPGGSGTFFYVAVALGSADGYTGTAAVLLGDRISYRSAAIGEGLVTVTYAERRPGEPMTTSPSVEITRTLRLVDGELVPTP